MSPLCALVITISLLLVRLRRAARSVLVKVGLWGIALHLLRDLSVRAKYCETNLGSWSGGGRGVCSEYRGLEKGCLVAW